MSGTNNDKGIKKEGGETMKHDVVKVQFFDIKASTKEGKPFILAKAWATVGINMVKIQVRAKKDGTPRIKWPSESYRDRQGEYNDQTLFTVVPELRDTLRPARDAAILRAYEAWVKAGRVCKQVVNIAKVKKAITEASKMTVRELKKFLKGTDVKVPAGADKAELVKLAQSVA